jgi:hypothetical protein
MPDIPKTPKIKQKQGFKKMAFIARIDWALQLPTRKRQQPGPTRRDASSPACLASRVQMYEIF